jgi:cytochrome c oxidase subunit 2
MTGKVVAMEPRDYENWLAGNVDESPVKAGERLFSSFGCDTCHQDGPGKRVPLLRGAYGKPVRLQGGKTVLFDDAYVRTSIVNPNAEVTDGYPSIMPTFQGQLTEEQIMELILYIKSLTLAPGKSDERR